MSDIWTKRIREREGAVRNAEYAANWLYFCCRAGQWYFPAMLVWAALFDRLTGVLLFVFGLFAVFIGAELLVDALNILKWSECKQIIRRKFGYQDG